MTLPPGAVRTMDSGLVAVPPVVANGTWAQALTVLHAAVRREDGRTEETPSMIVIDTHLARGSSTGKGTKRVVAVDVTGLPVAALVVSAFGKTTTSATGWLQVACIATTLRHLSRERTRRRLVALAERARSGRSRV